MDQMKMVCIPTNQGTAISDTALCEECYKLSQNRLYAREQAKSIEDCLNPFGDFVDCSQNEVISCCICGQPEPIDLFDY